MGNAKFNLENKRVLDSFLLKTPGVAAGKMFGYPHTTSIRIICLSN